VQIFFRVDASIEIGTGHVMRCLTLAHALSALGARCQFMCRPHPGHLINLIRKSGFIVHRLALPEVSFEPGRSSDSPHYVDWLGATPTQDATDCASILQLSQVDLLVVDHYALDATWESLLMPHVGKIMVIDDLAQRPHSCDILMDQNAGRHEIDYAGLVPTECALYIGPKFALLRPEFARYRPSSLQRRRYPALKNLLVSLGGVDKENHTSRVLEALNYCCLPPACHITVIMGARAPWIEEVKMTAVDCHRPTEVLVDVDCMASIMSASDLAIGAVGMTALERCSLGLPSLAVVTAANQVAGAKALEALGALVILDNRDNFQAELVEKLSLHSTPSRLSEMQRSCAGIVDGTGATVLSRALIHD